jgi:DNA-binding GntR family transcriptional regulator
VYIDFWDQPEIKEHHEEFDKLISSLDELTRRQILELDTRFHVWIFEKGRSYLV